MLRTHQGEVGNAPTPALDIAAITNEQAVYVPLENHRNSLREAKHQQNLLKVYFNHIGTLALHEDMI